ncbi:MAG: ABC transporter ATP-binding protein [Phycisphaeraceae bacterium]|nr:ABC transporter ATP-binding protein [Phycisphaerales bacterium]MCB9860500.1 ABC transporter ATP-binding protein [Phycisphaeraceae bacterium]
MIDVRQVSKSFGRVRAVREVSFDVAKGQVAGLLGANGAGKTTTIRMITGFFPPDAGSVSISGHDVLTQSGKARSKLGYLPEAAPAYVEMPTKEYLFFRGRLQGLYGGKLRKAVRKAMDQCDLHEMRRRRVGHLSKGYRQRVGLAAAILHNPPVLILDEPTNGLDPTQIRQARSMIRELSQDRAVLMSSHILPEIELTCDRVIIMSGGRVEASGTIPELVSQSGASGPIVIELRAEANVASERIIDKMKTIAGVTGVVEEHLDEKDSRWCRLRIDRDALAPVQPERIARCAVDMGCSIRQLSGRQRSLESVFVDVIERARSEADA